MDPEQPDQRWDIFIAHASKDHFVAERLYDLLSGHCAVFLDSKRLLLGDDWDRELPIAQRQSQITVVLVSPRTENAYYEREEIARAIGMARQDSNKHRVVPVFLESSAIDKDSIPYGLQLKHGLRTEDPNDLADIAKRLTELLAHVKNAKATAGPVTPQAPSNIRIERQFSVLGGTIIEVRFRLRSEHVIKYVRHEGFVFSIFHLYVDDTEVFSRRVSHVGFFSVRHTFKVEDVDCVFECKLILGAIWAKTFVGNVKVFGT